MISSILLYGSEIWEPYINYTSGRRVTKPNSSNDYSGSTSNILSRAEVGKFPLQAQILERNIKYLKYVDIKNK